MFMWIYVMILNFDVWATRNFTYPCGDFVLFFER